MIVLKKCVCTEVPKGISIFGICPKREERQQPSECIDELGDDWGLLFFVSYRLL